MQKLGGQRKKKIGKFGGKSEEKKRLTPWGVYGQVHYQAGFSYVLL